MEFLIFGADGKTLLVKAEVRKKFNFKFQEGEEEITLEGTIEETTPETFERILSELKLRNPDFKRVNPAKKPYVFKGLVNGSPEFLPVKEMDEVVKDIVKEALMTAKFKRLP